MNRVIKFRAWDKGMKVMYEWKDLIPTWLLPAFFENEELEIMQFTGLTDVNGKEIYEGDVIQSTEDKSLTQVIKFIHQNPADDMDVDHYGYHINPYWKDVKVIGNIYENADMKV